MRRRQLLKTFAWLTGGLLITRCTPAKLVTTGARYLKGAVRSKGAGVAGVLVSDGYSVVQTDRKGKFEFAPHPEATAVFMSTPSGYHFSHEKGISRHYRHIAGLQSNDPVHFDLIPLDRNDEEHDFIIWADTQVRTKSDVEKLMNESVPDVQKVVAAAGPEAILHAITVGDIVWDDLEFFNDYNRAVEKIGIPFFQCLGNHDMDFRKGGDDTSDDTFTRFYGPTYYSFNRGQVHYVVLDNVRYLGTERDYDGFVQQHQLDWLRKDLSFVPKDKLIVLSLHIPVHNGVKNNSDLYAILEDRDVHIMSGHTHYNVNAIRNNIYEHNHGTVCGAWWTGAICGDGTPSGYALYSVKGTALSWQYKSTGHPVDYQMKMHVTQHDPTQKLVLVNIWNHDPAWKTEFWIDGERKGSLEQIEGFDPVAYQTMLGPGLPNPRGFAEPNKTNHLFKVLVPASAREIIVSATDRFGKTYTEKHSFK